MSERLTELGSAGSSVDKTQRDLSYMDGSVQAMHTYGEVADHTSIAYARSRHALADTEALARTPAEKLTRWLQLSKAVIRQTAENETSIEFLSSPPGSTIVPFTADGKIILIQRESAATKEDSVTVMTRTAISDLAPDLVALQALHKLNIPGSRDVLPTRVGSTKLWKYLDTHADHFAIDLPVLSTELSAANIADSRTKAIVTLSEQEFYESVENGQISDLMTLTAVQLALAQRTGLLDTYDPTFQGDPHILDLLEEDLNIVRRETIENETVRWFPQEMNGNDIVMPKASGQAQALGIMYDGDIPQSFVMLIEPFFAQGKASLTLASGSVKDGNGAYTAISEMKEETGYNATDPTLLVLPSQVMPLFMNTRSQVWEVRVTGAGDKEGGDEQEFEQGQGVIIPISEIGWYIRHGHITDTSTLAAILTFLQKNQGADTQH